MSSKEEQVKKQLAEEKQLRDAEQFETVEDQKFMNNHA